MSKAEEIERREFKEVFLRKGGVNSLPPEDTVRPPAPPAQRSELYQEGDTVQTVFGPGKVFKSPSAEEMRAMLDQLEKEKAIPPLYKIMPSGGVVRKHLKINVSGEYPDKTFASMTFGCDMEEICSTPEEEGKLAERVYKSTMADLKDAIEHDPMAKSLWRRLLNQLRQERAAEHTRQRLKAEKAAEAATRDEE